MAKRLTPSIVILGEIRKIKVGAKGGTYYVNSKGNKTYLKSYTTALKWVGYRKANNKLTAECCGGFQELK